MTAHHLHLVSDSTGETISTVARACLVQFSGVEPIEHVWSLVRTRGMMTKVINQIEAHPGPVLYTLVNRELRDQLTSCCQGLGVPCIAILDPVIHTMANYFGAEIKGTPGLQHVLDAEYFGRMDAMTFALTHDDGQHCSDLAKADIILVGVSRTSKTPTCMYLANRGIKAANIPVVPGCPMPEELLKADGPLIVGLTKDPARLVQVRQNSLRMLTEDKQETYYVNLEALKQEIAQARRFCNEHGWPLIDVTRRSIEETAATIMNHYARHIGTEV